MGNCINSSPEVEPDKDPVTDFDPLGEHRYIIKAFHPSTHEKLSAEIVATFVSNPDRDGEEDDDRWIQVRWGRFWLKEPGSDSYLLDEKIIDDVDDQRLRPQAKFSKYMSFVQTVGSPGLDYHAGEVLECRDQTGKFQRAVVKRVEAAFYYIEYKEGSTLDLPPEWIHRFSTRIRKVEAYESRKKTRPRRMWDTFHELDWIRVKHPTTSEYEPAKIIVKDDLDNRMVVQYDNDELLVQQEALLLADLEDEPDKVEGYKEFEHRWRFNRTYVYEKALLSIGLRQVTVDPENGHSLFRALSLQLFGTPHNYLILRLKTLEHISRHKDYFENFVDINIEFYLAHKKKAIDGDYFSMGDHLDIQAICELFDARVEVYSDLSLRPLDTIRFYQQMEQLPLIRLSYRGNNHYDSIEEIENPLPLKIKKDFRYEALGNHETERHIIFNARMAEWRQLQKKQESNQIFQSEITMVTYAGPVRFYPEEFFPTLRQFLFEVNLGEAYEYYTFDEEKPFKATDRERVFSLESNPDIIVHYPSHPMLHDEHPTMRLHGSRQAVEEAVEFLTERAEFCRMREWGASSRVDFTLGSGLKKKAKRINISASSFE